MQQFPIAHKLYLSCLHIVSLILSKHLAEAHRLPLFPFASLSLFVGSSQSTQKDKFQATNFSSQKKLFRYKLKINKLNQKHVLDSKYFIDCYSSHDDGVRICPLIFPCKRVVIMMDLFSKMLSTLTLCMILSNSAQAYCSRCAKIEEERAKEQAEHPQLVGYYEDFNKTPSSPPDSSQTSSSSAQQEHLTNEKKSPP